MDFKFHPNINCIGQLDNPVFYLVHRSFALNITTVVNFPSRSQPPIPGFHSWNLLEIARSHAMVYSNHSIPSTIAISLASPTPTPFLCKDFFVNHLPIKKLWLISSENKGVPCRILSGTSYYQDSMRIIIHFIYSDPGKKFS